MDIFTTAQEYLMPTYRRQNICLTGGRGATLTASDGREYIDFASGIGVNSLGYGCEKWVAAIAGQAALLQHTSNLYYTEPCALLARDLCERTGFKKAFFCNSGAEANECAIKLARKYSFDTYGEHRGTVVSLVNSFHGRTMATITATGQEEYHNFFHPFPQGYRYTPPNDIEALAAALGEGDVCALLIEVIQGEGGVMPLDEDFVKAARDLCTQKDIVLICDEVQSGIGRTGKLFAFEHYGLMPDVATAAKGLGNGLPVGVCLAAEPFADVLTPGTHASTFGGNPVVCAGARVVLETLDDAMLASVEAKGEYIASYLRSNPEIAQVRGRGLMIGAQLKTLQAADVLARCAQNGLLLLTAKKNLRLLPPLTISDEEIDKGLGILAQALENTEGL